MRLRHKFDIRERRNEGQEILISKRVAKGLQGERPCAIHIGLR
jgi:hypothetical protein